jgi:hypothetical protein
MASRQDSSSSPVAKRNPSRAASPVRKSPKQAKSPSVQIKLEEVSNKLQKKLTKSAYDKYISDLEDLTDGDCMEIIDDLKTIADLSKTDNKPKITNPKTRATGKHTLPQVFFDSDIVLTALSRCYFNNDVKEVKEVIDPHKLLYHNELNSSRSVTSRSTIQPSLTIYDAVKQFIELYRTSCNNMKSKTEITFSDYVEHMKTLLHLLQAIQKYYSENIKNQEYVSLNFNLFDEKTKNNYINHVNQAYDMSKPMHISFTPFRFNRPVKNVEGVLENTYLNRSLNLNFGSEPNILFNHMNPHQSVNEPFEYHKYMSILPKYHCLDQTNVFLKTRTVDLKPNHEKDLVNMLKELNTFTQDFPDEYIIKGKNKQIYKQLFEQIKSYTDDNALNKLLFVLINNNYNKKPSIQDYYYYFPHDGPAPASSLIEASKYVKYLHTYQPLNIKVDMINRIEENYKGTAPLYSKIVNEGLQNHLLHNVYLTKNTIRKINAAMEYTKASDKQNYEKEDIYIFHGTQTLMHAQDVKEINLLSFLSCSFNIYIAIDYALNNLLGTSLKRKKGIVYVFKVTKQQKYVNFSDALMQVILLPGTKIIIKDEINIGHIKYVLCHIDNNDNIEFGRKLLEDIQKTSELSKTIYTITPYKIASNKTEYPIAISMQFPAVPDDFKKFRQNVDNIFVISPQTDVRYIYTCLGQRLNKYDMHSINNIQYTLHQHIINNCYRMFDHNCTEYVILYDDNNIFTGWMVDDTYDTAYNDFNYDVKKLLIDSLFGFVDCHNSKNYLLYKGNRNISRLVWMNGCGLFNAGGFRKPRFAANQVPFEYLGIFETLINNNAAILRNINKERLYDLLNCSHFSDQLSDFIDFLKHIRREYLDFISNQLQIKKEHAEYNTLSAMVNDVINALHYRAKYFQDKMDDVLDFILEYISDTETSIVASGGGERKALSLQPFLTINGMHAKLHDKKQAPPARSAHKALSPYKPGLGESQRRTTYQMIKNIPLPTDTQYELKHLHEPYKSYYTVKNTRSYASFNSAKKQSDNILVNTFNEGYCVSNKEFETIRNRLFAS